MRVKKTQKFTHCTVTRSVVARGSYGATHAQQSLTDSTLLPPTTGSGPFQYVLTVSKDALNTIVFFYPKKVAI